MLALQLPLQQCWENKLLALPLAASQGGTGAKGSQLCHGPRKAPWGLEGILLLGEAPSSLDDRGRKEKNIQAMLFISPGTTPQTEQSSITETQGGSD